MLPYNDILVYDRYDDKYITAFRRVYYMAYYLLITVLFSNKDNKQVY